VKSLEEEWECRCRRCGVVGIAVVVVVDDVSVEVAGVGVVGCVVDGVTCGGDGFEVAVVVADDSVGVVDSAVDGVACGGDGFVFVGEGGVANGLKSRGRRGGGMKWTGKKGRDEWY